MSEGIVPGGTSAARSHPSPRADLLDLLVVEEGALPLPARAVPWGWAWDSRTAHDLLVGGVESPAAARVLLVLGPRPATVARLRSRFPMAGLLALVEHDAPMALVVEALEAGADTCVRSSDPRLLSAHLSALAAWTARARTLVTSGGGGCR